ncbi:hypothetical protein CYY_010347 [Polysphondylium violaceum]|uniref:TRAF-type domain-containing protein n=1 Tax=Polysphondylium violaceum TaxID=133409 RepID=A0A8J4PK87_9MYCE|nr:hypothetical protein CYY_010347 [Polysphondylium violaceum]
MESPKNIINLDYEDDYHVINRSPSTLFFKCKYCNDNYPRSREGERNHYNACREYPILCGDCKMVVTRKDLLIHLKTSCENAIIPCPYVKYGCQDQFKRGEIKDHIVKYNYHIQFLLETIDPLNKRIEHLGSFLLSEDEEKREKYYDGHKNNNTTTDKNLANSMVTLYSHLITLDWFNKDIRWYALNSDGVFGCKFNLSASHPDFKSINISSIAYNHQMEDLKRCVYNITLHDITHKEFACESKYATQILKCIFY